LFYASGVQALPKGSALQESSVHMPALMRACPTYYYASGSLIKVPTDGSA
jgi:hypothetical protein